MARVSPIQDSFNAGEIGERVRGRTKVDAYKNGLAECRNWWPLTQGPVRLREGSKYITPVDTDNWTAGQPGVTGIRCFTFPRGLDNDAIIEIGVTDIKVRSSVDGSILDGGVSDELIVDPDWEEVSPGFLLSSTDWDTVSGEYIFNTDPGFPEDDRCNGGDISAGLSGSPGAYQVIMHSNSDGAPDGWYGSSIGNTVASPVIIPAGSELLVNEFKFTYYQGTQGEDSAYDVLLPMPWVDPKIRVNIGTTKGGSDVHTVDVSIGSLYTFVETTISFTPGATNNTLYFTIGYVWTGTTDPVPDIPTEFGCSNKILSHFIDAVSWRAPLTGGSGAEVTFASPYTTAQLECLQFCVDPGEQVAYLTHPEVETQRLRFALGEWTLEALSAITLPSVYVAPAGAPWVAANYPSACAIHEGRLWLAGTPNESGTLWGSRSGDYQDFNGAAPASADDPLLFPLSSSGNIQTITSRKDLVINTDISEVIGTSQNGIIAFNDFSFPKQSDWGSNCVQPVAVGRGMIFTSNSRTRLRTFADEGGTNFGYDGNELSLLAQEIFSSPVRRMIYLDEPSYQACFLLTDGTMGMATYYYQEGVIGWWRYATAYNGNRTYGDENNPGAVNQLPNTAQTVNQIMDITKINTSAGAKLWMIINRTGFSGTTLPGHEVLSLDDSGTPPITMDSWASRAIDVLTGTIDDLAHLTDQSVNCVIESTDGVTLVKSYTVHPNITVIAGESSVLESWAVLSGNIAHVGLFYDNNIKLLPLEGVSYRGTSQVTKRRWNKVYLRVNNSAIPLINGEYPRDRTPATPMGLGEPFATTDMEYSELGSDQGELEITQDRPLNTEILAIFGKLVSGEV